MDNTLLEKTTTMLSRIQGVGNKSAKRILLDLIKKKDSLLLPLITTLQDLASSIVICPICQNIDVVNPCSICSDNKRAMDIICIVEDLSSLWAIEKTKSYNGKYFVLGASLSATKYSSPAKLNIDKLITLIIEKNIQEVIIATPATIEGQITANYIQENIHNPQVKISMLAQGIPIGGELDYLDEITLSTAIRLRKSII
jgi:recombination protein RecR